MKNYRGTLVAGYIGYVVQALVINFAPLLFITFQTTYHLSLSQISALIMVNFSAQLMMDFLAFWYVNAFGYRICAVAAHLTAAFGTAALAFLPDLMPNSFGALCLCMVLCGMGGGLIEVIISPIVEALPTVSKSASMSLLHSFYSWGQLITVLLTTLYFVHFGLSTWRTAALLWALIPLFNGLLFLKVPLLPLVTKDGQGATVGKLLGNRRFWVFLLGMMAAGASEQAVIQWGSAFAEKELMISKAAGDLLGPSMFALLMGLSRVLYAVFHERLKLWYFMLGSAGLLCVAYVMVTFSLWPPIALTGYALCGLAVGIMWPGMISLTTCRIAHGGTAMFALLAFFGDVGCLAGPGLMGLVSDAAGASLRTGFLVSMVFPSLLIVALFLIWRKDERAWEETTN